MIRKEKDDWRQQVADKLRQERDNVEDAIAQYLHSNEGLPNEWQEKDSPSEVEIREVEFRQLEALQTRLRALEWAQNRFQHNDYGLCVDCGKRIALKRLLNDPTVERCIDCQAATEMTEHLPSL
jgi:RNA polymerase-binding transcription factor DksA